MLGLSPKQVADLILNDPDHHKIMCEIARNMANQFNLIVPGQKATNMVVYGLDDRSPRLEIGVRLMEDIPEEEQE